MTTGISLANKMESSRTYKSPKNIYHQDHLPSQVDHERSFNQQNPNLFAEGLAVYRTPPSSPIARTKRNVPSLPSQFSWLEKGMDSDDRYRQQYRTSAYQSSEGVAGDATYPSGQPAAAEQSRQFMSQGSRRNPAVSEGAHTTGATSYGNYPYGDPQSLVGASMQASSVPGSNMQFQEDYASSAVRHQPAQPSHQQPSQQYPSYPPSMVYGVEQQATAQSQYSSLPHYQSRPPTGVDLSGQYGTSQYYGTGPSAAAGIPAASQYMGSHVDEPSYSQAARIQPFSTEISEYDNRSMSHPRQEPPTEQDTTDIAYERFQIRVRLAFEHIRAGRLQEASRELLTISEWLLRQDVLQGMVDEFRVDIQECF